MTDKKPPHRPTDYTPEMAAQICDELVEGNSLVSICRRDDRPAVRTVYQWLEKHDDFAHNYARARSLQAETMADMVVDMALNAPAGADPNRLRVKVDALKWRAGKLRPTKYGEAPLLKRRAEIEYEREMINITPEASEDENLPQLDRKQLARVIWHIVNSKQKSEPTS